MSDRASLEKLNKQQLIDYTLNLIQKFNEQNTNYTNLYSTYQMLVKSSEAAASEEQNVKFIEENYGKEIATLKEQLQEALNKNSELSKTIESLNTVVEVNPETVSKQDIQISNLIKENEDLKNEIVILKSQKPSTKLSDINSLEKCKNSTYTVQTYNINAFENRVDNSEIYGGRKFIIASVLVKLENLTFTWSVDFKGSEIYPARKEMRKLIISEEDLDSFLVSSKAKGGMFNAIKDAFDIKDNFSPDTFFSSALFVAGEKLDTIREEIK